MRSLLAREGGAAARGARAAVHHRGLRAWYRACKPGIVGLTLISAFGGAWVAQAGRFPDGERLLLLFLTLGLVTAGSCLLNNVYDRDIDALMGRTRARELVHGAIAPKAGLLAGLALMLLPLPLMAWGINPATAALAFTAAFGYSVLYTVWAKRRTSWANQIGGAAGAMPPLIGYAAVAGGVDAHALVLYAIMVVWQQPHALSLALKYRAEYARAGIPVVPVADGVPATKRRIFLHALLLLPLSAAPYLMGFAGPVYLAVALALGAAFLLRCYRFLRSDLDRDMRVFLFSIVHLCVMFSVLMADVR
jgi:protoheme IX farnesyltransferase